MTKQPKLTMGAAAHDQTPTQQLIAEAAKEHVVTDVKGRRITLRKPDVLAQFRIIKVLGDAAANRTYVSMVLPLIFVSRIDDQDIFFPRTEAEVDALIQRLDDHGVTAVALGVQEHWAAPADEAEVRDGIKK